MQRGWIIALAVLAVGVIGYGLYHNNQQQRATEEKLKAMQQQMDKAASKPLTTDTATPTAKTPTIETTERHETIAPTTAPAGSLQKIRQTRLTMEEGWKLIDQRNPTSAKEAVAVFQEALERIDASNAEFYNGLGRANLIAGNPDQAITAWRKGLELAPKIADMQSGLGWAYWAKRDYAQAKLEWEKALKIDPKSRDAWSALAWIYLALKEPQRAKVGFQILHLADTKNPTWISGLAMAQASNSNPQEIAKFFPLPPLEVFTKPVIRGEENPK